MAVRVCFCRCRINVNYNDACVDAVRMAGRAQVCLNEMFRVMEPYENMLPADRMADYTSLNKIGLMQMSKIYNLMWGGSITDHGVSRQSIL
jgi:hypothetical protein